MKYFGLNLKIPHRHGAAVTEALGVEVACW